MKQLYIFRYFTLLFLILVFGFFVLNVRYAYSIGENTDSKDIISTDDDIISSEIKVDKIKIINNNEKFQIMEIDVNNLFSNNNFKSNINGISAKNTLSAFNIGSSIGDIFSNELKVKVVFNSQVSDLRFNDLLNKIVVIEFSDVEKDLLNFVNVLDKTSIEKSLTFKINPSNNYVITILDELSNLRLLSNNNQLSLQSDKMFSNQVPLNTNYVLVRPNPFLPNDGKDKTGRNFSLSEPNETGIIFDRIPANSTIKIFTVNGSFVTEKMSVSGGRYQWDTKNDNGVEVASGVYIFTLSSPKGSTTGKFVIVR